MCIARGAFNCLFCLNFESRLFKTEARYSYRSHMMATHARTGRRIPGIRLVEGFIFAMFTRPSYRIPYEDHSNITNRFQSDLSMFARPQPWMDSIETQWSGSQNHESRLSVCEYRYLSDVIPT